MERKTIILSVSMVFGLLFAGGTALAQTRDGCYDVFIPIAKYIRYGDADKLSAWFADNLEVSVLSSANEASRNQARQIVKNFFDLYTPRAFEITHTASRSSMKYAIGSLSAGGETFGVAIFASCKGNQVFIQQIKIEKSE